MTARRWVGPAIVTALYAAIVVWAAAHHEPWRDEVVPLSIARHARSPSEFLEPLKFEGHPILWYLLLWCGWSLVGRTWVLKAASVGSATLAIFLVNCSPLPWWLRCLFTFSFFPLYEYSVICRGYGLEMLALFTFCALHPRRREHPLALAVVLAMLANTEAFGAIMAVAAAAMLAAESVMDAGDWRRLLTDRWVQGAVVVYLCGLVLAAAVALPDSSHTLAGFWQLPLPRLVDGIGHAIAQPVAHAIQFAVLPMPSVWVWGYFLYLTRRPPLLCFAAIAFIGIEALFNLVYGPGAPWHAGHAVLVLVATMWLDASDTIAAYPGSAQLERVRKWLGRVLAVAVTVVFAGQVPPGVKNLTMDLHHEYSSSRRLAELLGSDPQLAGAVVMGEPDTALNSLPYYADNQIYLARERVYRPWGIFSSSRPVTYDLGALLQAAREVRQQCGCPVVITLGFELGEPGTYTGWGGTRYEQRFVVTTEARDEFLAATRLLAHLGPSITDESYDVYVLR